MGEINRGRWTTVYEKKRHRLARAFNGALGVPEADYRPGESPRQDVVIFDNLASHLWPSVSEAIEDAVASVSPLPPYRPDFNPIEEMFSKFKEFLGGPGPRSTSTTPLERDYERSRPRISWAGIATPERVSCKRDPL